MIKKAFAFVLVLLLLVNILFFAMGYISMWIFWLVLFLCYVWLRLSQRGVIRFGFFGEKGRGKRKKKKNNQ